MIAFIFGMVCAFFAGVATGFLWHAKESQNLYNESLEYFERANALFDQAKQHLEEASAMCDRQRAENKVAYNRTVELIKKFKAEIDCGRGTER